MPASNSIPTCPVCSSPVPESKGSRQRKYCSDDCRERAKRAKRKNRYQQDPQFRDSILAMNDKYFKSNKGVLAMSRASSSWKSKNAEKRKAHIAVQTALRGGILQRQNRCEVCGAPNTDAHHEDYNKPLSVQWLCRRCHHHAHGHSVHGA